MKRQILSTLALAATGLWLFSCDSQKVTGTVDETNASAARLLDTAGTPVAGANLLVFQPQDTMGKPIATGLTLADGTYSLPIVADGMYRVVARIPTGKTAVQDSVYTNQGKLQVRTDTVRSPGSLYGVVEMVGDDNPKSVEVSVLGSDASVVNVGADGTYRLDGLGAGTWKLRFASTLSGYTNTYVVAQSKTTVAVKVDTVTMNYIDIPPVAGLKSVYDTVTGLVRLSWTFPSNVKGIRDIEILRADRAGTADPALVGTSDSASYPDDVYPYFNPSYLDFSASAGPYPPTTWLYNVRIRTNSGSFGKVAYVNVATVDPASITPRVQVSSVRPGKSIASLSDTVGLALAIRSPKFALGTITWQVPGLTKGARVLHVTRKSPSDSARVAYDSVFVRAGDIDSLFYGRLTDTTIRDSTASYVNLEVVDSAGHKFEYPNVGSMDLYNLKAAIRQLHQPKSTVDTSGRKDSTTTVDTTRHDTIIFVDSTHRDSVVLSQRAIDSLRRTAQLDSLARLISYDSWLLGDSAKAVRDSTGRDTTSLRQEIVKSQHQYDSLSAAPLAGVVGTGSSMRMAWNEPKNWSRREALAARWEDLWLRDEKTTII
jgi:hypothetical protein